MKSIHKIEKKTSTSIIGIHGLIGVGKDTAANYIAEKYKYVRAGFADSLKYVCAELFLENPSDFFNNKEEVMPYWGITRRAALQFVGTELVRDHLWKLFHLEEKLNPVSDAIREDRNKNNHLIRVMEKRILDSGLDKVVINDLRFQNEAQWVLDNGGVVLVIERAILKELEEKEIGIKDHQSEAGLDLGAIKGMVYRITNNQTIGELYARIDNFMEVSVIPGKTAASI